MMVRYHVWAPGQSFGYFFDREEAIEEANFQEHVNNTRVSILDLSTGETF
jgi:hypothetical protein